MCTAAGRALRTKSSEISGELSPARHAIGFCGGAFSPREISFAREAEDGLATKPPVLQKNRQFHDETGGFSVLRD